MQDAFDVIVLGGGIIGRLTGWRLAAEGKLTLLLEKDTIERPLGSSKGGSRLFGDTHFRDIYSDLARQSHTLWRQLERQTGERLLYQNGGFDIVSGRNGRDEIKEIASKLKSRRFQFEIYNGRTLNKEYPQWKYNSGVHAVYSPSGGVLKADDCMSSAIEAGKKNGLKIEEKFRVKSIEHGISGTVLIKSCSGKSYRTKKLIIAAGPWAINILGKLGVEPPLCISQEQVVYFRPRRNYKAFMDYNFPVWEFECSDFVYGFPIFEESGIKIAFHRDGRYLTDISEFSFKPREDVTRRLRSFLNKYLPDAAGEVIKAVTCMYTNTPDQDFIIDTVPGFPQIYYFTGDSGHAFHCAPAVAETLAELAREGKSSIDVSCFSAKRFRSKSHKAA